jgi:Photosynthesis system II assembly factor YCF48/Putative zinc-finger
MSEGIPKSVRELLAKQAAWDSTFPPQWGGDAHPSSDLLNAYAEQCLSEEESKLIVAHLAACAACREIVFVATAAAEEELQPLPADAATLRLQAVTQLQMPRVSMRSVRYETPEPEPEPPPQSKPATQRHWWKWAVPAVAALILVGVGVVERDQLDKVASPRPRVFQTIPRPSETPSTEPVSPSVSSRSDAGQLAQSSPAARERDKVAAGTVQKNEVAESQRAGKSRPSSATEALQGELSAPPPVEAPTADAKPAATAKAAPTPPRQTDEISSTAPVANTPNGGNDLTYISPEPKPQSLANSAMGGGVPGGVMGAMQTNRAAPARWRISSDGHVEHTVGQNTWERVMSAEPVTFYTVTTIGPNVWAGGSDGALYHSADGGHEWNRVALAGEQGTIKTIHFSNSRQGSLTTNAGTVWTTADGGITWSKQ